MHPPQPLDFLTNTQGVFRDERLAPGFYTVRVTLAGFLPTLEKHIRVSANLTTLVRIQLESMFASLEQLRRAPSAAASEADDWKWVLRSASSVRPVLQWVEEDPMSPCAVDVGFCSRWNRCAAAWNLWTALAGPARFLIFPLVLQPRLPTISSSANQPASPCRSYEL